MVSDLTYVQVGAKWAYICILLDLGAREIIGYSGGAYKNADLVHKAFSTVKGSLFEIQMFHTDRGSEFDNALIDELLDCFIDGNDLSWYIACVTELRGIKLCAVIWSSGSSPLTSPIF